MADLHEAESLNGSVKDLISVDEIWDELSPVRVSLYSDSISVLVRWQEGGGNV